MLKKISDLAPSMNVMDYTITPELLDWLHSEEGKAFLKGIK